MSTPIAGPSPSATGAGHVNGANSNPLNSTAAESLGMMRNEEDNKAKEKFTPQKIADSKRKYEEIQKSQAAATEADILGQGIFVADPDAIARSLEEEEHPVKRRRMEPDAEKGKGASRKYYTTVTVIPDDMDDSEDPDESDSDLDDAPDFFEGRFTQLSSRAQCKLRKLYTKDGKAKGHRKHTTIPERKFDLISSLASMTELIVEICKYLKPTEIVSLYSISREVHDTLDRNLMSSIRAWTDVHAPTSARIFSYQMYASSCILDPLGRPRDPAFYATMANLSIKTNKNSRSSRNSNRGGRRASAKAQSRVAGGTSSGSSKSPHISQEGVRMVPTLRWFQMVMQRERRVRDILAVLARNGHRVPPTTHQTLKKMWLLMDVPTNAGRSAMMHSTALWTRNDLYNAQLFFVKLLLQFNDPIFGPKSPALMKLMLGQRDGLSSLWALLRRKRFLTAIEIVRLKVRYDLAPQPQQVVVGMPCFGVPIEEMGQYHIEGWGKGTKHLMRPDELVPMEAVRRGVLLDRHIMYMMFWGHVDMETGENLVPSLEEMYMSDEELPEDLPRGPGHEKEVLAGGCGNVPFEDTQWKPKHARRARPETLTAEERRIILQDEEDEELKRLPWYGSARDSEHDLSRESGGNDNSESESESGYGDDGDGDVDMIGATAAAPVTFTDPLDNPELNSTDDVSSQATIEPDDEFHNMTADAIQAITDMVGENLVGIGNAADDQYGGESGDEDSSEDGGLSDANDGEVEDGQGAEGEMVDDEEDPDDAALIAQADLEYDTDELEFDWGPYMAQPQIS